MSAELPFFQNKKDRPFVEWFAEIEPNSAQPGQRQVISRHCTNLPCCGFDPRTTTAERGREADDPNMILVWDGRRRCKHAGCGRHPLDGPQETEVVAELPIRERDNYFFTHVAGVPRPSLGTKAAAI